jgi:hypothetical protein
MKKILGLVFFGVLLVVLPVAQAQQLDVAFGVGTMTAPSAETASQQYSPQSLTGGAYPVFSANVLLKKAFGVSGNIAWRGSQNLYAGYQPYRPLFYDINALYAPKLSKYFTAELMGGIGAESIRFYQNYYNCSYFGGCTNYTSSNHFMGHFGAGLRYYVHGNFFIRPEAHLYLINNNNEFSSPRATRFGISIGYSFRPGF